ncbi:hypothetical protein BD626DRAFT_78851 [Schizophyllum amplum]|uniref:Uncharacterized protein n=1 Tax=Schizophyllum amplum TaxID=97359 RepID=A0A550C9N6_9AGAR|nr:hypothetical protein BD626DRAFT_78851 [Auriculariopsis ampla]
MEFDDFYEQLWAPRAGMSVLTERRRAEEEGQRRVADQEDEARNEELRTQLEQMRQQLKDALEAQQRAEERAGEMAGEYEVDEEGGEGMSLKPGLGRKGAPQPLHLIGTAFGALGPPSSASSEGRKSVQLSYLDDEEGRRRVGVVFDEIVDIGLEASGDFEESDDDDPYDRRKSQIMMKAKLDEIERTLNQLSPAKFKHDEDLPYSPSFSHTASLSPSMIPGVPKYNRDVFPPTPKLGPQMDPPASPRSTDSSWPAVPFSALASPATSTFGSPKLPDNARLGSPEASQGGLPTLAVNGVSTSAPPGFGEVRGNGGDVSAETVKRRKMLEEHESTFTGKRPESSASNVSMQRPQSHRSQSSSSSGYYPAPPKRNDDSPIIPLSPDPFGRSDFSGPGSTYWENPEKGKVLVSIDERIAGGNGGDPEVNSSRFSADSLNGDEKPAPAASASSGNSQRSTIMSVKGIRKLWRKSNKASVSQGVPPVPTQPVAVGRTSSASASSTGRVSPSGSLGRTPSAGASSVLSQPNSRSPTPSRPERPSQELVDLPDPAHQQLGRYSSASSRPSMEQRPSTDGLAPPMAKMMAGNQRQVDMRFDQESPYPTVVPRSRQPSNAMPPPSMQHPSPPSGDEQQGARRSILKSKGGGSISEDKRQRRPSVTSIRASLMNSPPPESIPPSPKLPEHFMPHMRSGSTASKTHNRAESGAHARTLSGATSRSGVSIASRSRMTTPTIDEAMERSGGEQPKSSIDSAKGNVL